MSLGFDFAGEKALSKYFRKYFLAHVMQIFLELPICGKKRKLRQEVGETRERKI